MKFEEYDATHQNVPTSPQPMTPPFGGEPAFTPSAPEVFEPVSDHTAPTATVPETYDAFPHNTVQQTDFVPLETPSITPSSPITTAISPTSPPSAEPAATSHPSTGDYGGFHPPYATEMQPSPQTTGWHQAPHTSGATQSPPPNPPLQTPPKKRVGSRILRYVSGMIVLFVIAAAGGYFGSAVQQGQIDVSTNPPSLTESKESAQENASANATPGDKQLPVVQTGNIPDIVDKTAGSVVEVKTEAVESSGFLQQYTASGAGSGVIVSEDGYIVTNHHVINGADKITVTLKNGTSYDATLVGTDEVTDLAVLKIEATDLIPATFGDSDSLRVGEMAIAIGNPLGELGGTVTSGLISALDREITIENQTMTLLQTNAAVNPGNSGGGLFNDQGELIGIVNAKTSASGIEGLGFAIPSNVAKPVIDDLIENGYVTGRIRLGVSFVDITTEQIARQYRVEELGAYVYQVMPGSDAEKAGLQPGDLVHMIGDKKIYQSSEIKTAMNDYSVGDQMVMTIKRNGNETPITVTFTENRPESNQTSQFPTDPQLPQ